MKRIGRKLVAALLCCALAVQLLPMTVLAAARDVGDDYNEQVMAMLEDICDSEEDAQRYYAMLEEYGFMDEDGNVAESWSITMDGQSVTLDEIRELLDDPACDMTRYVVVDGTPVTLSDLETMIEIEDYIAYLEETYYTPQAWSEEALANLDDLVEQINTEGIELLDADDETAEEEEVWTDGSVDHSVRLSVTSDRDAPFTVTVTPSAAQKQDITFYFRTLDGSAKAGETTLSGNGITMDEDGKVTIPAGSTESAVFTIAVSGTVGRVAGSSYMVVQLYNLTNALFEDGTTRWEEQESFYTDSSFDDISARISGSMEGSDGDMYVAAENDDYETEPGNNEKAYTDSSYTLTTDFTPSGIWLDGSEFAAELSGYFTFYRIDDVQVDDWAIWRESDWANAKATTEASVTFTLYATQNGSKKQLNTKTETLDFTSADTISLSYSYSYDGGQELWDGTTTYTLEVKINRGIYEANVYATGWGENVDATAYLLPGILSSSPSMTFRDTAQEITVSLSAPAGTYYSGQTIPITATYSYPMGHDMDTNLEINNKTLRPEGTRGGGTEVPVGFSGNSATYFYTVADLDSTSVSLTGAGFQFSTSRADGTTVSTKLTDVDFDGVVIDTPDKEDAIAGIQAEIEDPVTDPMLVVTVGIVDDEDYTTWFGKDLVLDQKTNRWTSQSLSVLYDGEEYPLCTDAEQITGQYLTAEIPIELNTGEEAVTRGVELLIDGAVSMDLYATTTQDPALFLTADDIDATLSVCQSDGETPYNYVDETYSIWIQDQPAIYAAVSLKEPEGTQGWSFGDVGSTTTLTTDEDGNYVLADKDADFVWWIGDEDGNPDTTIANIDAYGKIAAVGTAGDAYVYLTALNGDNKIAADDAEAEEEEETPAEPEEEDETPDEPEEADGRAVTVRAYQVITPVNGDAEPFVQDYLTFDVGLTPFLYIPYDQISSVAGQDVTVYWTSNLCDKNGAERTEFSVTLTRNGDKESLFETAVYGTAEDPASGYTISGDDLTFDFDDPDKNIYILTVSSVYEEITYTTMATISLLPTPAVVTLADLDSYYIADDPGTVPVEWDIESFQYYVAPDAEDEDADIENQFLLLITDDAGDTVYSSTDPGTPSGNGEYSGSYGLAIPDVVAESDDPASYRTIYTVTIAAKNGSDSTWSYDSFLLYIYDRDALDIWINGESSDRVTLSNVKAISEMSQEEILALNRDIYLKAMISVNYGEYAWTELTDQMEWVSEDSGVAYVGYQQGSLYENVEHYTYTSYRPTTEFGISGLDEGETTITATHALTGISDSVTVDVERLDNQLYLFQCYPQTATTLYYTNGDGEEKTVTSADDGSAAIYEESGIASDVYCQSKYGGDTYLGTIYNENLKSGEDDWALLERYPCNELTLRKAAYAYMYLKNPDGTPYQGEITIRSGIYLDGKYVGEGGKFDYNGEQNGDAVQVGNEDYTLKLDATGRLEIKMDQTQWGLATGAVNAWNDVSYVFEICLANDDTTYYPMLVTIDATVNEAAYVGSGEAVVTFRENPSDGKHAFVISQMAYHGGDIESVLDGTGSVGPSEGFPTAQLYTMVMWWGEEEVSEDAAAQLFTSDGTPICTEDGKYDISQGDYPFSDKHITTYSLRFDEESLGALLEPGESTGLYLEYYKDGSTLTRREDLTFTLTNMIGVEEVTDSNALLAEIQNMGVAMGTDGDDAGSLGTGDKYVNAALNFVSDTNYTQGGDGIFSIQLAPTSDPTKFLGFMEVNIGGLEMDGDDDDDDQVHYATSVSEADDWDYWPGMDELETLAGKKSVTDYFKEAKENVTDGASGKTTTDHDLSYALGGYMETLIYYDYNSGNWKMKMLSGGFNAGGGFEWCWNFNTWVAFIPFTATLKIGAEAQVSLDALTAAYTEGDGTSAMGSDILTELRMYLYLYFFAGVGIDYAVLAFKLGVYGQVDLDMRFDWLNRNYLTDGATPTTNDNTTAKLKGQHFAVDGEVGLQLVIKLLFISYEKVLFSYSFNLLDKGTGQWNNLQAVWESDQDAYDAMIEDLVAKNSISIVNVDGIPMMTVNLAPTMEDVSYLSSGSTWGSGIRTMSLDAANGLDSLNENSYAYADPVVTEDGGIVAFLGVPAVYGITGEGGISSSDVAAMYAFGSNGSYANPAVIPEPSEVLSTTTEPEPEEKPEAEPAAAPENEDENGIEPYANLPADDESGDVSGIMPYDETDIDEDEEDAGTPGYEEEAEGEQTYGDSELTIAGNSSFAVAAWTSQTVDIQKDDGAELTEEDQRMMEEGTDICVSVYTGGEWTTVRIENGGADLAPVVATDGNGSAIVAWRSVAVSDSTKDLSNFDQKDEILYKIYSDGAWSKETYTLYNGTNGNVKGITAEMLDGTAAVAYAIDTDEDTETYTDREIVYAVIGSDGEVVRNVRATNDNYLDENPQLTTVSINGSERFLLGWYTEQTDDVDDLDGNDGGVDDQISSTSDIRLIDFDKNGSATQLMPDSIHSAATGTDVTITSDFAFTKSADSIDVNDLSIVWSERTTAAVSDADGDETAEDEAEEDNTLNVEHDLLKAVKFYTYGNGNKQVSFTGAAELAEMPAGTLVDSFDAYTINGTTIKAVIMGTTYGADGVVTREDVTEGGDVVSYAIPSTETSMYTATETYGNTIDVPSFLPDYEMLKLGAKTEIMFRVENKGIDPITSLSIDVGGQISTFDVNILPGDSTQVYAAYQVPGDAIRDEEFTVTATFSDGSVYTFGESEDEDNVIYMNLPDIQITDASIIREEDGERDILIKLNNTSDAALGESSNTSVRLSFYSDATYESPIEALKDIEITDATDLKMIDEGGYSTVVTFNVAEYLEESYGELTEIPETGVNVYIQAEVIDNETGEAQGEVNTANNYDMVTCENLQVRTGQDVTITSTMDISGSTVNIQVDLQNTRLTETTTGNVVVTLLGEDGSILAQKQSYDGDGGLLTLGSEEAATETFTFKGITGAFTVDVQYVDMILDADEAPEGLASLTFPSLDENITLENFIWDESQGAYVYTTSVDTLYQMSMIAIASDARASITVNGETTDFYTVAKNLDLVPGEANVFTITVTNQNGVETTYILTVYDETVTVAGSKTWDDDNDRDGVRPKSITIRLLADGEEIDSAEVTASDDWTYVFTNLPVYSGGEEIVYTITEDSVDGYATVYDGYDITNSYTPDQTSVTVVKSWDDSDDWDSLRPKTVTVQLLADGEAVEGETLTLSETNDWVGTFTGLNLSRDGGTRIAYSVEEVNVPDGYEAEVSGNAKSGYVITNSHSPEVITAASNGGSSDDGKDVTGTIQSPKTNDASKPLLVGMVMATCAAAIVVLTATSRKKRYEGRRSR